MEFKFTLKLKFKLFEKLVNLDVKLADFSWKWRDFYYSLDYDEFGWGTCPHISYKITVTVLDADGKPAAGASISETGLAGASVTGEDGIAAFYLPNGTYTLTAVLGDLSAQQNITVQGGAKELTLTFAGKAPGDQEDKTPDNDEDNPPPGGEPADEVDVQPTSEIVDSGTCGENVTWTLYGDGLLWISGTGAMYDYFYNYNNYDYDKGEPWLYLRDGIARAVIDYGVTSIGNYAFFGCEGLTSVTIPYGVTSIGESAFFGCEGLTSITIPYSVTSVGDYAFFGCEGLTSVMILGSITSIGNDAFYWCESLTSITLPDSMTYISSNAFYGCDSLKDVYYTGSDSDWAAISIGQDNDSLTNATIHYNWPMPMEAIPPGEEEDPAPAASEPVEAASDEPLVAQSLAYSGTVGGGVASFTGLVPGAAYVLLVTADPQADRLLAPENLLFIAQGAADSRGALAFAYRPRAEVPGMSAAAYGPEAEVRVPGDATGDGKLDGRDLLRLQKHLAGIAGTEISLAACDVTGDGKVDGRDLLRLQKYLAGVPGTILA